MKKQIVFFAAAAVLAWGASAQPNDMNQPPRNDAPTQAYGNSGWTPDMAYGEPQPRRGVINDGRYLRERERERERIRARELERERIRAREIERQRERERARARARNHDRDGDGVPNRYDSRPDNPYRR